MLTTPAPWWRRAPRPLLAAAGHPLAVPLLLAALLLAIGAQVACVFAIPSWSNDEPAHLGYVAALAEGNLPTIDTLSGFHGRTDAHDDIWTANHAPAFHALMVPVWWLTSGDVGSAVVAMRLLNTVGFACWLVLVALVARELVPRRPAVASLAAAIALAPTLALRSGFLMNDGLGSSAAVLTTLMVVRMLRHRFTTGRVVVAALAGAVAAGTRAPGVLVVVVCFVTLLIVGVRRHGWRRGLVTAGVVGGVPALATGWFYLRNYHLYGDFTGQDALLEKFQRAPIDGLAEVFALRTVQEMLPASALPLMALLTLTPIALVRLLRRPGTRPDPAWIMLTALAVVTLANLATFVRDGGGLHDRYLMQVMPLLATVTALGMLEVGRWWRTRRTTEQRDWALAAGWTAALLLWLAGALWWFETRYSFYYPDLHGHRPVGGIIPELLVGVAVLLGVAVVACLALRTAASPAVAPPQPEEAQSAEPWRYSENGTFQSP